MLFWAFAVSLIVHAIVALYLHPPVATMQKDNEVFSIVRRSSQIEKLRTPPPRPHATPVPHPVQAPTHAPTKTRGPQAAGTGGSGKATPAPTQPPTPTVVAASPGAGCAQPEASAAVLETPGPPDISTQARAEGTTGIALIKVALDAQGAVTDASVAQSTGNASLDTVAVAMARDAKYQPALHACKPIAADYTFSVKFVAW